MFSKSTFTRAMHLVPLFALMLILAISVYQTLFSRIWIPAKLPSQSPMAASPAATAVFCGKEASSTVSIDGSELITPITQHIAQEFMARNPSMCVVVGNSGTVRSVERFCNGEIEIAHVNETLLWLLGGDREKCRRNGIEWLQLPLAKEGFGNFVSIRNDFVECVTIEQNRQIWQPTDAPRVWSMITASWPDQEIHLYAQLNKRGAPIFIDGPYDETESLDRYDATLVDGLAADPFGIGLFSAAYYARNKDRIRPVSVNVGDGCISPNPLALEADQNPIWASPPVYIYVNREQLRKQPVVRDFLDFYMTKAYTATREGGFIALSPEEYEENREKIYSAVEP